MGGHANFHEHRDATFHGNAGTKPQMLNFIPPAWRLLPSDSRIRRGLRFSLWWALHWSKRTRRHLRRKWYIAKKWSSVAVEVPIHICVNPLGFSFGPEGWHYLVELLREYDQNPELQPQQSVLRRYYQQYQPDGMAELLNHIEYTACFRPPFFVYPWGNFKTISHRQGATIKNQSRSRFCGPTDEWLLTSDFYQTIALYEQIKREGYRPWLRDFIGGVLLQRADGAQRYVVLDGNHRLAALVHLGVERVMTAYLEGYYQVIRESNVHDWYYVRTGACSESDALAYFRAFFQLNGRERAIKYQLMMPPELLV